MLLSRGWQDGIRGTNLRNMRHQSLNGINGAAEIKRVKFTGPNDHAFGSKFEMRAG